MLDWLDQWRLAFSGMVLATRDWRFLLVAMVGFLFFGTLMNLLAGGTAAFNLLAAADFGGKMGIIGDAFLNNFGVGRAFYDWLVVFFVAILQGVLIGLVVLVWRRRAAEARRTKTLSDDMEVAMEGSAHLERTGLAAGLAVLSSGCPTCGTTLLAPLLGAVSSSGGMALAGTISGILMIAAVVVGLYALKKLGLEAYVILGNVRRKNAKKEAL